MGKISGRPQGRLNNQPPFLRRAGLYLGVAFELPGSILAGLVLGYFLDAYLGTSPWLLIALTVLAFVAAFVRLMKWVRFFANERNGSRGEKDDPQN